MFVKTVTDGAWTGGPLVAAADIADVRMSGMASHPLLLLLLGSVEDDSAGVFLAEGDMLYKALAEAPSGRQSCRVQTTVLSAMIVASHNYHNGN